MENMTPVQQQKVGKMIGDMRFVGLFYIIYGAMACLTIIGAVLGIPIIISGLRLRESADFFSTFQQQKDENALLIAFDKQGSFFHITKILILIALAIIIIEIVVAIFISFAAILGVFNMN